MRSIFSFLFCMVLYTYIDTSSVVAPAGGCMVAMVS